MAAKKRKARRRSTQDGPRRLKGRKHLLNVADYMREQSEKAWNRGDKYGHSLYRAARKDVISQAGHWPPSERRGWPKRFLP